VCLAAEHRVRFPPAGRQAAARGSTLAAWRQAELTFWGRSGAASWPWSVTPSRPAPSTGASPDRAGAARPLATEQSPAANCTSGALPALTVPAEGPPGETARTLCSFPRRPPLTGSPGRPDQLTRSLYPGPGLRPGRCTRPRQGQDMTRLDIHMLILITQTQTMLRHVQTRLGLDLTGCIWSLYLHPLVHWNRLLQL
jgi:hypothetical protein